MAPKAAVSAVSAATGEENSSVATLLRDKTEQVMKFCHAVGGWPRGCFPSFKLRFAGAKQLPYIPLGGISGTVRAIVPKLLDDVAAFRY